MRASMGRPLDMNDMRPSWGLRCSAMSSPARILIRFTTPVGTEGARSKSVVQDPVDAQAEAQPAVVRFDVHVRGTFGHGPVKKVLDEARHLDVVLRGVVDAR